MRILRALIVASVFLIVASHAQNSLAASKGDGVSKDKSAKADSTYISADKGIGPITTVKLGPIDSVMAEKGQALFKKQCVTCHLLDKKKLGPPLRDVTKQRPPEFIMNMMLNTDKMEKKDPEVKKLINKYQLYMTVLSLTKDQARELLEYLRLEGEKKAGG